MNKLIFRAVFVNSAIFDDRKKKWITTSNQIDVFKMHHWDNPAKRSSLKWIQYSMDWENILDMPIHHETKIETQAQLAVITEYCINDVESTEAIYKGSKS